MAAADLLFTNVSAVTMDPALPRAGALAVAGNRIVFVGSAAGGAIWRGAQTRVIDGNGATLLPGFTDSHFHLQMGALQLRDLHLEQVHTLEALAAAVRQYAQANPQRPWLFGQRLAYNITGDHRPLTRHHLDAIEAERPLVILSADLHTAWANSRALAQAGILSGGPTPPGSEILMAGDGTALGQLNEKGAFRQVTGLIPEAPEEEKLALLRDAARLAAGYGLTGVHNMDGDAAQFARYARLDERGELPLRIYAPYSVSPETTAARFVEEATALKALYQCDKVRLGAAKFFMDGVIESFTALMVSPYANRPEVKAEGLFSLEHFTEMALLADQMGLQIAVHAIGDGAVRRVLDGYAAVRRHNGPRDSRHRIEHIELLHPDDLPRFTQLGVVASMQPIHASRPDIGYFPYWLDCVRPEQYGDAFAWRTLLEQGVPLTLGSDWPVTSLQVATGIEAAVNRTAWAPGLRNQALTLMETLAGYTVTPAWVEFREHDKGRLRTGMLADLVLLDRDWLHADPAELGALRPQMTVCDGAVTYAP